METQVLTTSPNEPQPPASSEERISQLLAGADAYLTRDELIRRWKCSYSTIQRREKDGTLTVFHIPGSRLVRYRLSEILKLEGLTT